MKSTIRVIRLLAACAVLACASGSDAPLQRRTAAPSVRMTRIAPGVTLEVLDWGGRGTPIVFLAGLGSTAHVFDDFAPQFTDNFHVVGITRRGFGASAGSLPPSELDTLVADITAILDTLDLRQAVLVGHSIAGEEMTRFAETHGPRCAGLVYLDAAYDRSGDRHTRAKSAVCAGATNSLLGHGLVVQPPRRLRPSHGRPRARVRDSRHGPIRRLRRLPRTSDRRLATRRDVTSGKPSRALR